MSAADGTHYRRIRWQNGGIFSRGSLWLADDHLLQITSLGVRERYQRFYFRDIKALMTCDVKRGLIGGAICGFSGLFFALITVLVIIGGTVNGAAVFAGVLGVAALLLAGYFLWRGRMVRVYVVTELQTALLRSVARKWQAENLLAELSPLISAAQADLRRNETPADAVAPAPQQPQQSADVSAGTP